MLLMLLRGGLSREIERGKVEDLFSEREECTFGLARLANKQTFTVRQSHKTGWKEAVMICATNPASDLLMAVKTQKKFTWLHGMIYLSTGQQSAEIKQTLASL